MRFLLDTHTLLWFALGDPLLSGSAKREILNVGSTKLVSAATYWEIAIKVSIGKLALHAPLRRLHAAKCPRKRL